MEPKKNTKADVGRNSSLYFAVGLALMMLLAYMAINYRTYDKAEIDIGQVNIDELEEEEVPITEQNLTPPPPPPPPPAPAEEIEIVEDEVEIEETVIESTETNQEEEIVEVEDVEVEEVEEEPIEVPFAVIENVPVFPGCENEKTNEARKKCMSEKIQKIVTRKFNTDLAGELGLSGRQRIFVTFKVDKNGNVTNVQARAPHPRLAQEAKRVVGLIPKMQPGKQRGKAVIVPYSLPIMFQVQD